MRKANKKLCTRCGKRRSREMFLPRARICEICREVETVTKYKKENSLPQLKKKAQTVFNAYIRKRDKQCISCGGKVEHAGHFIAQGASGYLRYSLENVNGQCVSCNSFKHGNLIEYRIGLVEKIGEDQVKRLESRRHQIKKWTREELQQIIRTFK